VRYSLTNPYSYERSNCLGTLTLLELCRHYKVNHFVFASSSSVYGKNEPPFSEEEKTETQISVYAATKKFTEVVTHAYSHLFGIKCTGIRFFTVYGPWGRPDMALNLWKPTLSIFPCDIRCHTPGRAFDWRLAEDTKSFSSIVKFIFRCWFLVLFWFAK